jgi:hypothetical protein
MRPCVLHRAPYTNTPTGPLFRLSAQGQNRAVRDVILTEPREEGLVPVPKLFPNDLRPMLPPLSSQEGIRRRK